MPMPYLILIFVFFLVTRLIPYIGNSIPTGYDAGIYLHIMKTFPAMPHWLVSTYYSGLFYVIWPLTKIIDPEHLLLPLLWFGQILLFFVLYYTVNKLSGKKQALIAVFLFSVSAIQFRSYWFFYLKNIYALSFFLLSLTFLGKQSYKKAAFWALITGIVHLPTFLILSLIWLIQLFLEKSKRLLVFLCMVFIASAVSLFYSPYFTVTILPYLKPVLQSFLPGIQSAKESGGGTFYSPVVSLILMGLYLPLAVLGAYRVIRSRNNKYLPFIAGAMVFLIILLMQAVFFRRYFIVFDLLVIVLASLGFDLVKSMKTTYCLVSAVFIIAFIIKTGAPLVNQNFLSQVRKIDGNKKIDYILSTSPEDTAWLLGYTDKKVIAWGYGGYDRFWNDHEWNDFFAANDPSLRQKLINKLPLRTFIFVSK
jgi:hypothetical protein